LIGLVGCGFDLVTCFVNLTMAVSTTITSLFQLWQVSRVWHVLPQLVYIVIDFVVIINYTIGLAIGIAFSTWLIKHYNSN
jgi:hypothetical protein